MEECVTGSTGMNDAEMTLEQIVDMLTLKNIKLPIEYER